MSRFAFSSVLALCLATFVISALIPDAQQKGSSAVAPKKLISVARSSMHVHKKKKCDYTDDSSDDDSDEHKEMKTSVHSYYTDSNTDGDSHDDKSGKSDHDTTDHDKTDDSDDDSDTDKKMKTSVHKYDSDSDSDTDSKSDSKSEKSDSDDR